MDEESMIPKQLMEEIQNKTGSAFDKKDLVNAIVDDLIAANVDLNAVTLSDMKRLMSAAARRRMREFTPPTPACLTAP